jgi:hypothetical protein
MSHGAGKLAALLFPTLTAQSPAAFRQIQRAGFRLQRTLATQLLEQLSDMG